MTSSDPTAAPPPEQVGTPFDAAATRDKPGVIGAGLKFGIVGAVGIVVNLTVLHLLHVQLGWGFTRSSAIATEVAIIGNYLGNELFTFHLRQLSWRRLAQYNATALVSLGVTVVVATVVKELIDPLLAQLIGIAAGSGLTFAVNFGLIWRR